MGTRQLTLVGYLTWLIIGIPSVMWEFRHHTLFTPRAGVWAVCFVLFIIGFGVNTRTEKHWFWLLVLQAIVALGCVAMQPLGGMQPVLLVMVAGQLSGFSFRNAILFDIALMAGLYAVTYRTGDGIMIVSAYFAFTLFAMFIAFGVRTVTAVVIAVVGTAVIWYAFYKLLRVPLPWGVLERFAF